MNTKNREHSRQIAWATAGTEPPARRAAASSGSGSRRVQANEAGQMVYRGFPAALASGGEPVVLTPTGWMSTTAFEASELTDEDLAYAAQTAQMFPESKPGQAFRNGPGGGGL